MGRRGSIALALVAFVSLTVEAARQASVEAPSVTLFIGVTPRATQHEPIELRFVMRNDRSDAIDVNFGKDGVGNFQLTHLKPDGTSESVDLRTPSREALARGHEVWSPGERRIAGRNRYEDEILLDERLDFSRVGIHHIGVTFIGPVTTSMKAPVEINRSWKATVEILPRNVAALRRTSERLVREIQTTADPQQALKTVKKLAAINDPTTVPYLVRVIEGPKPADIDLIPIQALERIGTAEARDALQTMGGKDLDPDTVRAARSAVDRLDRRPR